MRKPRLNYKTRLLRAERDCVLIRTYLKVHGHQRLFFQGAKPGSQNYGPRSHFVNDEKNILTKNLWFGEMQRFPKQSYDVRSPASNKCVVAYVALGLKSLETPGLNQRLSLLQRSHAKTFIKLRHIQRRRRETGTHLQSLIFASELVQRAVRVLQLPPHPVQLPLHLLDLLLGLQAPLQQRAPLVRVTLRDRLLITTAASWVDALEEM